MTGVSYDDLWSGTWNDTTRYGPACRHRRRIVAKLVLRLPHQTICDLGCGDGRLLSELSRKTSAALFGADVSATAVEQAGKNVPDASFRQMDLQAGTMDRNYDVVIMSEVLEHIEHDTAALKAIAPHTRHIVISVPGGAEDKVDRQYGHYRNYHHDSLKKVMNEGGFDVIFYRRWGFPFHEILQFIMSRGQDGKEVQDGAYTRLKIIIANILYGIFFLNVLPMGRQVFAVGRSREYSGNT